MKVWLMILMMATLPIHSHAFLDAIPVIGDIIKGEKDAKMIEVLLKMTGILGDLNTISEQQADDIYKIYRHFDRLGAGDEFLDILIDKGFDATDDKTKKEIWKAQDISDELTDFWVLLQERKKENQKIRDRHVKEASIKATSKSIQKAYSKQTTDKVNNINTQIQSTKSLKEDQAIKQGVNFQARTLQETIKQTENTEKALDILQTEYTKEALHDARYEKAFSEHKKVPTEKAVQEYLKIRR